MANTYRALVCCRAGAGSSVMLKIKCDQVIETEGLPIETEHGSLDDAYRFDGDLIITLSDLFVDLAYGTKGISRISIVNAMDKNEIAEKLAEWVAMREG